MEPAAVVPGFDPVADGEAGLSTGAEGAPVDEFFVRGGELRRCIPQMSWIRIGRSTRLWSTTHPRLPSSMVTRRGCSQRRRVDSERDDAGTSRRWSVCSRSGASAR